VNKIRSGGGRVREVSVGGGNALRFRRRSGVDVGAASSVGINVGVGGVRVLVYGLRMRRHRVLKVLVAGNRVLSVSIALPFLRLAAL
jgi:hypothetical protein